MAARKKNYRDIATWYALGREDAGEELIREAEDFGTEYASAREVYEDGSGFMPSMRRAFRMWQQGKPVTCEE